MNDYDFRSLNDKEFEILSRDLLQCEMEITFESFKAGKDKGIDLRCCNAKDNTKIIVQAKHWSRSGLTKLLSHLRTSESKKVNKIKPERYIIVTSVELSPQDKESIKEIFSPFIISESDILGKEDLNNLLGKFPEIEKSHYKLWLSSTAILQRITNNGVCGRSEFAIETIMQNIEMYVSSEKHQVALNIINKERVLLIIGAPGIGKTSLARMIAYELLGNDYQLITVEDIKEAESLWETDKKQVFYFDDFLGSNYFEIATSRNNDSSIVNFIKRIKNDPFKRLILTSRTIILTQAVNKLPKFQDSAFDLSKHEVKVSDYKKLDRALILYNHLYFKDFPEEFYEKITEDKNYFKIINHKHFNPRIIEFITNPDRIKTFKSVDYLEFVFKNLEYPHLIWSHPYENQIDDYSRFLLTTLFSLNKASQEVLRKAFESRMNYEIANGGFQRINNAFSIKIRELLDGFIKASRDEKTVTYEFFDPSVTDFLIEYLNNNPSEKWRILESVVYIEQLTLKFSPYKLISSVKFTKEEIPRFYNLITKKESELVLLGQGSLEFSLVNLYYSYFEMSLIKNNIIRLLDRTDWSELTLSQSRDLMYLLEEMSVEDWSRDLVDKIWDKIISNLFRVAEEENDFEVVINLFDMYDKSYEDFINDSSNKTLITQHIEGYWENKINEIEWGDEDIAGYSSEDEIRDHFDNIRSEGKSFNKKLGVETDILDKIYNIDVADIADTNRKKFEEEDYLADVQEDEWKFQMHEEKDIDNKIVDLFESR